MFTRWRSIGFGLALAVLAGTPPLQAQSTHAQVLDGASLFTPGTVEKANQTLQTLHRDHHQDLVIETVESLEGESPEHRAIANAKALKIHGLYVLISKADHKLWIEPSRSAESIFSKSKVEAIKSSLMSAFKQREFDQGLLNAVGEIERDLNEAKKEGRHAKAEVPIPAANVPDVAPPAKGSSMLPVLIIGVIAVAIVLWLLSRAFSGSRAQAPPYGAGGPQGPSYGLGATGPGGYGPGRPNPGPPAGGPPPYGYGQGPGYPPPPGYGQPPRQGGGFLSSALGGIGGAVVGNILYDQFGRPHTPQGEPIHGDVVGGHQGTAPPLPPDAGTAQPQENYDPNAGAGGDWGAQAPPDSSQPAAEWNEGSGTGGDWGSPDEAGESGDWNSGQDDGGDGGDWGGDSGGDGGDWGDSGSDDTARGGDW